MPLFSASSEADLNEMMQLSRGGFMGQTMRESLGTVNVSVNNLSNWRAAVARQPASAIEGRTCAVVGSSSSLLRTRHGAEIDGAEIVMRINGAPTPAALQAQLGRRTSLYLSTFPGLRPVKRKMHKPAHLDLFGAVPVLFYCHVPYLTTCWTNVLSDRFERISPLFVERVRHAINISRWPSTGAIAIAFALHMCASVRLYGFGGQQRVGNAECAKYYDVRGKQMVVPARIQDGCTTMNAYFTQRHFWHEWSRERAWIQRLGSERDARIIL